MAVPSEKLDVIYPENTPGRPHSLKCRLCRVRPEEEAAPSPRALFIGEFCAYFGCRKPQHRPAGGFLKPRMLQHTLATHLRSSHSSFPAVPPRRASLVGLGKPCSPRQGGASLKSPCCSLGRGWEENIPPGAQGRGHESSSPCSPRVIQLESFFPPLRANCREGGWKLQKTA